jgi:hypothetical protein
MQRARPIAGDIPKRFDQCRVKADRSPRELSPFPQRRFSEFCVSLTRIIPFNCRSFDRFAVRVDTSPDLATIETSAREKPDVVSSMVLFPKNIWRVMTFPRESIGLNPDMPNGFQEESFSGSSSRAFPLREKVCSWRVKEREGEKSYRTAIHRTPSTAF